MSCHVEIDFHDDGSITMLARPQKGEEPCVVNYKDGAVVEPEEVIVIPVLGGDTDVRTHGIMIADWPTILHVQHMTVVPSGAIGVFRRYEWAS